jgi:hypothetical protein
MLFITNRDPAPRFATERQVVITTTELRLHVNKRYQVFVSSTFTDLKEERQAVLRAILELEHMPAGMELFPAADAAAWHIIRDVIDLSDYYVLVIGGRYGSLDETGIGYTEKEYNYAIETKKPVIALLHERPDNLPRDRTETSEISWERLKDFRAKVEKRHTCKYWKSPEDLKSQVLVALAAAMRRTPGVGWIRADQAARIPPAQISSAIQAATPAEPSPAAVRESSRINFFSGHALTNLEEAFADAKEKQVPIFMVVYDSDHPRNSRMDYYFRWFMDYETTKQLVRENFIQVLGDAKEPRVAEYIPEGDPLEHCLAVVLAPDGSVIRRQSIPGNPDEAMRWTKALVSEVSRQTAADLS